MTHLKPWTQERVSVPVHTVTTPRAFEFKKPAFEPRARRTENTPNLNREPLRRQNPGHGSEPHNMNNPLNCSESRYL